MTDIDSCKETALRGLIQKVGLFEPGLTNLTEGPALGESKQVGQNRLFKAIGFVSAHQKFDYGGGSVGHVRPATGRKQFEFPLPPDAMS